MKEGIKMFIQIDKETHVYTENEKLCKYIQKLEKALTDIQEEIEKNREKSFNDLAKRSFYFSKTQKILEICKKVLTNN